MRPAPEPLATLSAVSAVLAPAASEIADPLVRLQAAQQALETASTLDEVLQARDAAEAVRAYARSAQLSLGEMNAAAELRLRAERKAGQLLLEVRDAPRSVSQEAERSRLFRRRHGLAGDHPRKLPAGTLRRLGVDPKASSAWQAIAQLAEVDFERRISDIKFAGEELHTAPFVRASAAYRRRQRKRASPTEQVLRHGLQLLRRVARIETNRELQLVRETSA